MTTITKLTDHQEKMIPSYVDKWITTGMNCTRIDHVRAAEAVRGMYRNVDISEPKEIHFANGPTEAYEIYKSLGGSSFNNFMNGIMFGQHEAHWLGFYEFFKNEVGIKGIEKIDPLIEVAENCGWIYCGAEVAIVMDRPLYVKMDDTNRLHCENGPAIKYNDGFTVYSWHGVRVPGEWIENKASLTPEMALQEENMERRRAACEILGWANILDRLDSKVIDEDEDPMIGTLLEVNIPDVGREKFLKVQCGTGRIFAIPVPPDTQTALAGNAWTFNIEPDVLRMLEVRT
jgi:hypothetical protein